MLLYFCTLKLFTHLQFSGGCPRHGVCAWVLGSSFLFPLSSFVFSLFPLSLLSALCPLCSALCELCVIVLLRS